MLCSQKGRWFCSHHTKEDWVCSCTCRGTQEAEMMDLRQAVKSPPGGSSDGCKTQRQVTLGPKEVGMEGH